MQQTNFKFTNLTEIIKISKNDQQISTFSIFSTKIAQCQIAHKKNLEKKLKKAAR